MRWAWARFDDLPTRALHDALALRSRVFVVEQRCAYQDVDGKDPQAWHLLGWQALAQEGAERGHGGQSGQGGLRAYLRVLDPGVGFAEPSLGRVVIAPEARGTGLGHALLREGLAQCARCWPGHPVRIGAQAHLQGFYAAHGFGTVSAPYDEDGIAHVEMLRAPS